MSGKVLLGHTWRMCSRASSRAAAAQGSTKCPPGGPAPPPVCLPARQTISCAARRIPGDAEDALSLQGACAARRLTTTRSVHHATQGHHASGLAPQQATAQLCIETERIRPVSASPALSATPRIRVAVDIDEVLGRFVYALNKFCESEYSMRHSVSDYWVYEFAKIWGCDQERSNHIVHEFFKSHHFKEGIPPIPGALHALTRLSETCDLVVVTSRQHVIQDQTLDWIDRHYSGIFQEVYFGNHWSLEGVSRKKSDICKAVGATLLIDDNPTYAVECAAAGIHVLLYDWDHAYPWSKLAPGQQHPLIKVVKDWSEVEQQVQQLAPRLAAAQPARSAAATHDVSMPGQLL